MIRELAERVRGQQGGLLLDTNLLVMFLASETSAQITKIWGQEKPFTERHLVLLRSAVAAARRLVTTPHVLTEVSNLADRVEPAYRSAFQETFRQFIEGAVERNAAAARLAGHPRFSALGLTDIVLATMARRGHPFVLTVDADLTGLLEKQRVAHANLHHLVFR